MTISHPIDYTTLQPKRCKRESCEVCHWNRELMYCLKQDVWMYRRALGLPKYRYEEERSARPDWKTWVIDRVAQKLTWGGAKQW